MKLATLKDGTRDGRPVVVSPNLAECVCALVESPSLQFAIEFWEEEAEAELRELEEALVSGSLEMSCSESDSPAMQDFDDSEDSAENKMREPFFESKAMSPMPRSYKWVDGSAYLNHVELVRRARGASMPQSFLTDPLMYQGSSDYFRGPRDPILAADEAWGIDMEAEVAVIVGDVPMGASVEQAADAIRFVMLVNDVSFRNLIPAELGKGFGFLQSKGPTAFSPVAVTPDELGDAWDGSKLSLPLRVDLNGEPFGRANAGIDMNFGFPELIAHAARTRPLGAGTIVGSGTVSNKLDGGPGKPIAQGGVGYSCIAEVRMIETIEKGRPETPFMRFGDTVRIWMEDHEGRSIFGAIEQTVEQVDQYWIELE